MLLFYNEIIKCIGDVTDVLADTTTSLVLVFSKVNKMFLDTFFQNVFFHIIKTNNFQGDLHDISAIKEALSITGRHCRAGNRDIKAVLQDKRRTAMAYLLLDLPLKALSVARTMVQLQFDWPYGHVMQADAYLALNKLVAASSAYQLALHLMTVSEPSNDIGRPEVMQLCCEVVDHIVGQCRRMMTDAHSAEVTAIATWPQRARTWEDKPRRYDPLSMDLV